MRHPDFNPHFRKGSDASPFGLNFVILVISIHTSAREVTRLQRLSVLRFKISIHTSAREVTLKCTSRPTLYAISIHTSAREVTVDRMDMPEALGNFNPHFRKGSDKFSACFKCHISYFNPHFRKGSDCPHRFAIPSRV